MKITGKEDEKERRPLSAPCLTCLDEQQGRRVPDSTRLSSGLDKWFLRTFRLFARTLDSRNQYYILLSLDAWLPDIGLVHGFKDFSAWLFNGLDADLYSLVFT